MLRVLFAFLCLAPIAACDSAGPGFRGQDKEVHEVDGSRFTLRRQGDVVEAIRTNPEFLPNLDKLGRKAFVAAERMTGCEAAWIQGDPAMMRIGLACDGRPAPKMPKQRAVLDCDLSDFYSRDGFGSGALTCTTS
jgi:hypothetical protein